MTAKNFQTVKRLDGSYMRVELAEHEGRAYVRLAQYYSDGKPHRFFTMRPTEALSMSSGLESACLNITREGRIKG